MSFFLAVDLDEAVRAHVAEAIARHRALTPASWLVPEKLHVTVLFLGDRLPDLEAPMRALGAATRPFSLRLTGAGLFETARAPSVLWLGVGGDLPALQALRAAVLDHAGDVAPPAERARPFVPHLTLSRGKRPGHFAEVLPELERFDTEPFEVTHLALYESDHQRYAARWRAPFTATGA